MGIPVGILFGNLAGGWINEFFGWRSAFFLVGFPGIVLAIILRLTVEEPPRGHSEGRQLPVNQVPFSVVVKTMWSFKSFRQIAIGTGTQAFVGYGAIAWLPAFLIRTHDMSSGEAGTALGLIIGLAGGLGTFLGGWLGDRIGHRDIRWYMWIPAWGFLIAVPTSLGVYLSDNLWVTLAFYVIPAFTVNLYTGPAFGMTQSLAPLAMRASASALLLFIANMIGLVFGPTAVGFLSDVFQTAYSIPDTESLRWALVVCSLVYIIAFANFMLAARHLRADMARASASK